MCEMVELATHPWFVGCQFHPEFTSTQRNGHHLFKAFVQAAMLNALAEPATEDAAGRLQNIA